jgi:hypothetical protein
MKYLCLVYHDERSTDALPETFLEEVLEYQEALRQGGYHIAASPLQPVETATTIRVRNGSVTIADGPATSAPEQVGGFYLIDARDLNDAIRVAARMPPARYGSVEVRPLKEICPPERRFGIAPNDD